MFAATLKAATTGNVTNDGQPKALAHLMTGPKIRAQMALALLKHMTADQLTRTVLTEIRRVPTLTKRNQESFLGTVMQCAQLGLESGNALGYAYLPPFDNDKARDDLSNAQLIIGHHGMIDLARRSSQIVPFTVRTVHQSDQFSYRYGLDEDVRHVPGEDERGVIARVYTIAKLKDSGVQFEAMSKADVDKVRATSKASRNGPWITHYEEMAKGTAIRRLFKYLPVSIELQTTVIPDERADVGLNQDNMSVFADEYSVADNQSQDQVPDGMNTEAGEITEPAPGRQPDTGTDEFNLK